MNRLFFLIFFFWAEVREKAAAFLGVENEAAGGPESGAAAVSGLRTGKGLGTRNKGRDVDFNADLTARNAGLETLAPRSALLEVHLQAWGNTGGDGWSEQLVRHVESPTVG